MAITYTWTIPACEHDIATGGISTIHWRCTGVDGDHSVSLSGTVGLNPDPSEGVFTAYVDVTEDQVQGWVWDNVSQDDTEATIASKLNAKINPTKTDGTPWQKRDDMLVAYRTAVARLAQYIVADGRAEAYEDQPTGAYDDDGNEVMESVLVQTAIDPVDATVDQTTYDDNGENPVTTAIENPLITVDVAERAEAQAVVDGTPAAVVEAA